MSATTATPRFVRSPRSFRLSLLALCCLALPLAYADSGPPSERTPPKFDVAACYRLVRYEGRMIAWARWEERVPLAAARAAPFAEGTPGWVVDLLGGWIADAYAWQPTDEQIWQWAAELGNTENLPTVQRLTKHETIAIWLRRIARQCSSHLDQARSPGATLAHAAE
jgi:hypothetical protein